MSLVNSMISRIKIDFMIGNRRTKVDIMINKERNIADDNMTGHN